MEAVRMRPKVSAHRAEGYRRTQGSNIFGNETTAGFYAAPPGGELDFLARLEQAEARDDNNQRWDAAAAQNNREQAGVQYRQTLSHNKGSSIVFGDDSTPVRANVSKKNDMYQTTNQREQQQMHFMHEQAKERHEEQILMKLMVEDHGMSVKDAKYEIALYRQEQAQAAQAAKSAQAQAPQQAAQRRGLQPNGQAVNAHMARQEQMRRDQQMQRGAPSAQQQFQTTNQMQAHYQRQQAVAQQQHEEMLRAQQLAYQQQQLQQQQHMQRTRQPRNEFGGRYPVEPHYNSAEDVAAGRRVGADVVHAGVPRQREGGGRANFSAIEGGIFAPGVWS